MVIKKLISDIETKCPYRCGKKMKRGDVSVHLK